MQGVFGSHIFIIVNIRLYHVVLREKIFVLVNYEHMYEAAKVQTPGAHHPLAYKVRDAIKWCISGGVALHMSRIA